MIRLLHIFVSFRALVLVVTETLLTAGAFILAAYLVLDLDPTVYLFYDQGLMRIAVTASILLSIHFQDLYSQVHVKSRVVLLQQLSLAVGAAFLLQGMIGYLASDMKLPLAVMELGLAGALVALFAGAPSSAPMSPRWLPASACCWWAAGACWSGSASTSTHTRIWVSKMAATFGMGAGNRLGGKHGAAFRAAGNRGIGQSAPPGGGRGCDAGKRLAYGFAGTAIRRRPHRGRGERLRKNPRAGLPGRRATSRSAVRAICRRGRARCRFSAFAASCWRPAALAAGLPALVLAALAVRLASSGPVFERRKCVGRAGAPFTMYRLHSRGAGVAGRLVRRLRIDALPELFNVLIGDMALVGPHPERPEFVAAISRWIPFYPQRHTVRPGMTGWAQVAKEAPSDVADMLEYDLYYIKYMSLALDTFILFHSVKSALRSEPVEN